MSQLDATDLLCRSRREPLTAEEQRRLKECLEWSPEVKLMNTILIALDEESRIRPGDDLLLARINTRALAELGGRPASVRAPVKRRTFSLLVAAALLLVAGLAGAWLGNARKRPPSTPTSEPAKPRPGAKPKPLAKPLPVAPIAPIAPSSPIEAIPVASASVPSRTGHEARAAAPASASELFARANLLRRRGQAAEAAVLYEQLLEAYPNSREVGPTRLALGKYLQAKQPERALSQYRAVAGAGGALRAEALWGIAEVAIGLGERSLAEQALADLMREFPDSPYAEVARTRAPQ